MSDADVQRLKRELALRGVEPRTYAAEILGTTLGRWLMLVDAAAIPDDNKLWGMPPRILRAPDASNAHTLAPTHTLTARKKRRYFPIDQTQRPNAPVQWQNVWAFTVETLEDAHAVAESFPAFTARLWDVQLRPKPGEGLVEGWLTPSPSVSFSGPRHSLPVRRDIRDTLGAAPRGSITESVNVYRGAPGVVGGPLDLIARHCGRCRAEGHSASECPTRDRHGAPLLPESDRHADECARAMCRNQREPGSDTCAVCRLATSPVVNPDEFGGSDYP